MFVLLFLISSIASPTYPANNVNNPPDKKYAPNRGSLVILSLLMAATIEPNKRIRPKIIIAGMTKVIEATYVDSPLAIGVGTYAIYDFNGISPYYILGLLNSKYTSYYLRTKFKDKHLAGGYLAINKSTIEKLPFTITLTEYTILSLAGNNI